MYYNYKITPCVSSFLLLKWPTKGDFDESLYIAQNSLPLGEKKHFRTDLEASLKKFDHPLTAVFSQLLKINEANSTHGNNFDYGNKLESEHILMVYKAQFY